MYKFNLEVESTDEAIKLLYVEMNRLIKLREESKVKYMRGVLFCTLHKKYRARYSKVHLGYYDNLEDAIKVRLKYVKDNQSRYA